MSELPTHFGNPQDATDPAPEQAQGLAVSLGAAQPPEAHTIPVLQATGPALASDAQAHCTIAEGMVFEGDALLQGPCSVGGQVRGNLLQAPGSSIAVVIAETGQVVGDVRAHKISVMGQTQGTLDASGGSVAINDTASVSGHVRYGRLQVNGADLNATLERVPDSTGRTRAH